jgi:hypothetical protein
VAEDRHATEHQLQKAISGHCWIFGGRYISDEKAYRRLVPATSTISRWSGLMDRFKSWSSSSRWA